jgi:ubiquinone biosynthesis protein Coq4
MSTSVNPGHKLIAFFWSVHEKISSFTAHLIGPVVFNFGAKETPWNMKTNDFLNLPEETVGRKLGEFLKLNRLEPIAGAESHDVYHVLFDFSSSFKDEVALQFFLRGNGKNSIASFSTAIGAWCLLPLQWSYLRGSYTRGKNCNDISQLDLKGILTEDIQHIRKQLFNTSKN